MKRREPGGNDHILLRMIKNDHTHTLETNIRCLDIARINGSVRGWRKRTRGDRRQRAGDFNWKETSG